MKEINEMNEIDVENEIKEDAKQRVIDVGIESFQFSKYTTPAGNITGNDDKGVLKFTNGEQYEISGSTDRRRSKNSTAKILVQFAPAIQSQDLNQEKTERHAFSFGISLPAETKNTLKPYTDTENDMSAIFDLNYCEDLNEISKDTVSSSLSVAVIHKWRKIISEALHKRLKNCGFNYSPVLIVDIHPFDSCLKYSPHLHGVLIVNRGDESKRFSAQGLKEQIFEILPNAFHKLLKFIKTDRRLKYVLNTRVKKAIESDSLEEIFCASLKKEIDAKEDGIVYTADAFNQGCSITGDKNVDEVLNFVEVIDYLLHSPLVTNIKVLAKVETNAKGVKITARKKKNKKVRYIVEHKNDYVFKDHLFKGLSLSDQKIGGKLRSYEIYGCKSENPSQMQFEKAKKVIKLWKEFWMGRISDKDKCMLIRLVWDLQKDHSKASSRSDDFWNQLFDDIRESSYSSV